MMATASKSIRRRRPGARYFELVHELPLRSINNEYELDRAIAMLDTLIDRGPERRTRDESEYMEALSDLVLVYEQEHEPEPAADPATVLRDYIQARGLLLKDLAATAGLGHSTVSEIASGKRPMTRKHMERLAAALGVRAGVFLDR
jgi:antitoxin component HigA of HigAB toxin-antitoxin module